MTPAEFEAIGDDLMDAFVEAGFTDASLAATLASDGDEHASTLEINSILPREAVRLTELVRVGLAAASMTRLEDMDEAHLRAEVWRLRKQVSRLGHKRHEQQAFIAGFERRMQAMRLELHRTRLERDAFKTGDFSAALADQRAKLEAELGGAQ